MRYEQNWRETQDIMELQLKSGYKKYTVQYFFFYAHKIKKLI